ncbi:MAG: formyltransferase, partial [Steroidobacteraceae bacterium]
HYMVRKPDAGPIVGQERVPIGIDDTALTVSLAVAAAAARLLTRSLPLLAVGPPAGLAMDLGSGSYYGGRTPEDGRIDWAWPAARVHNLIRAVAPPFPGAFADAGGARLSFEGSGWLGEPARYPADAPCLYAERGGLRLDCADGVRLAIPGVRLGERALGAEAFERLHGRAPLHLRAAPPPSLSSTRRISA